MGIPDAVKIAKSLFCTPETYTSPLRTAASALSVEEPAAPRIATTVRFEIGNQGLTHCCDLEQQT